MFTAVVLSWIVCSTALIAFVVLARRRRGVLARELHEIRGALTAARLAVDLMPVLSVDKPEVCRAASDELERSYATLSEFEGLLHSRLVAPAITRESMASPLRRMNLDAHGELSRLAEIWGEAVRREGRELKFDWNGPTDGVLTGGPRRRFVEVVVNLLANALRHGDGRIDLMVRVRCDSLRIEVADQGRGLPGPLSAIARRPQRGEHGYGLNVARRSARALGGSLASAPSGSGAKLAFTVPAIHDPARIRVGQGEAGGGSE
jgi:signal transduction histidine kinase